jgi:two-component system, chemotaxis family, CheB/CheR fusion protein
MPLPMSSPVKKTDAEHVEPAAVSERVPYDGWVVGIGASAGGLEAMTELLKQLPQLPGLTLIIAQHLDPMHESQLVEILRRATAAPVNWATHRQLIEPGQVYIAPPHTCVTVRGKMLLLAPPDAKSGGQISFLFRSLAADARDCAVGVILSGNGSDGVAGLRAIHLTGGIVFAQEPATARFPAMPQAAIDARCVDRVLSPTGIGKELLRLTYESRQFMPQSRVADDAPAGEEGAQLARVFRLLASRTGVDFSDYKPTTIGRRLLRRMMMTRAGDLSDYVKLLHQNRAEVQELYEALLINVTEFFRDAACFEFLRSDVLPSILARHTDLTSVRIWVPGCATGEEVYSIAMVVRELAEESAGPPVQIFGTDVSESAIESARAGIYTADEVANVAPERLRRYFIKTDRGFVIQKQIRDLCVFARQNVVKDSPFSRLDLISCRNLLIYFGPKLQRKLIPTFHYALNPSGYLMLGSSESIGGHAELFRLVDRRFRIYARKSVTRRTPLEIPLQSDGGRERIAAPQSHLTPTIPEMKDSFDVFREADRIVLNRRPTAGVVVNDDLDILQFRGDVSPYLAPLSGRATLNLLKMAREGLTNELQVAVQEARENNIQVRRPGVVVMHGDTARLVDLDVTPIDSDRTRERFFLVLFEPPKSGATAATDGATTDGDLQQIPENALVQQLRDELQATRSYLQTTIEKHELTNQELRAANEEIQSSNEELQSTNEELETAKEELQSTNEELTTVNEELHSRQVELIQINNDLQNLINSVHLPIVILGPDLRIRRCTPMAEKVLNIIPTDIGRPLSDINVGLEVKDLPRMVSEVIDTLVIRELEVQDKNGRWYSLRLRPYKTTDNTIAGAVLALVDVDVLKRTLGKAEEARNLARAVIETTREPLAVLTADLRIERANDAFYRLFHTTPERAENRSFFEAVNEPEKLDELRKWLEGIIPSNTSLTNREVSIDLPEAGRTIVVINVRQVASAALAYPLILLSVRRPTV